MSPQNAKNFLQKMYLIGKNYICEVLEFLDIQQKDVQTAGYVLSALDFPLCKAFIDNRITYDQSYEKQLNDLKESEKKQEEYIQDLLKKIAH